MNLVLIGFMGCGKSTVAKRLSQLIDWTWVEMDALICQKTKTQNMHEVFAKGGELWLREMEIALAKEYAQRQNQIISCGGGIVLNQIALTYFKETKGKVLFLNPDFEEIVKRLQEDNTRPLFKDVASLKKMYDFRWPLYVHYADEILPIHSQTAEEIAWEIKGRFF